MVIRRSSAREVEELIARLNSEDAVARDAAIARLRVIGARAVPHLIEATQSLSPRARTGALLALQTVQDRRSLLPLISLLSHADPITAAGAAAALRPLIATRDEDRIIDALINVALDDERDMRVRDAAVRTLSDLGAELVAPLRARMGDRPTTSQDAPPGDVHDRPGAAALSNDPAEVRRMFASGGGTLSTAALFRAVSTLRDREAAEPQQLRRVAWMTARASAHLRLADRGSRVALYDLRETLETASGPLPVEFLSAAEKIGDATCAAAIASAYAHATVKDWWTDHLVKVFRAIVKRERLTRRSAALRRAAQKHPIELDHLFGRAVGRRTSRRRQ